MEFAPDSMTKMRDPKVAATLQGPEEPAGATMKPEMSEEEMFEALDVNKDGVVSKQEFTQFKKALQEMEFNYHTEWKIPNIKDALNGEPLCQLVKGDLFEWRVRVDAGDGKLRIVYEDVSTKHQKALCCRRFPAATFAWKVKFRGEEIFNDRPVFITFAERVALHWSTTLQLDAAQLSNDDDLSISVVMTENPLLSSSHRVSLPLILFHLSGGIPAPFS